MDRSRVPGRDGRQGILAVVLSVVLLVGCAKNDGEPIAWTAYPTSQPTSTSAIATPPLARVTAASAPTEIVPGTAVPAATMSAADLRTMQPNELGVIPVIEYHVITTDPAKVEDFTRLASDMRADLQWLYDRDFYVIPLRELLENRISAPAGKRPVVITLDDSTSSQFSATERADGSLEIDPDSAVGIFEAFFAAHPDFGHTAHFAIIPGNCFAIPDTSQMDLCETKVRWLAEHGYEIGNHTWTHENLYDVDDETFKMQIGKTAAFIDELIEGPANMSRVLTMPFGMYPDRDLHPEQRRMMREGFWYFDTWVQLDAALMVGANPTESPNSTAYDPMFIARIQMTDAQVDLWFGGIADGTVPVYISDGAPEIVTIPDPDALPEELLLQFDRNVPKAWDRVLIVYDPETGKIVEPRRRH